VTTIAGLISRADRDRLFKRLAEWREVSDLMRERNGVIPVPAPEPLHRIAERRDHEQHTQAAPARRQERNSR
jgi:hypothetical protein